MATKSMLETVIAALDARKGEWREIADASGVPYSTLCKIAQGVIPNPGVLGVQALYDFLTQKQAA